VLGEALLPRAQKVDREGVRAAQELVHSCLPAHGHSDERRLERERDERRDGKAEPLPRDIDGHDGDRGGHVAQNSA
jgi:hypothetical protein